MASSSFLNLIEVEPMAKAVLPKMVYDYYSGGSETMYTVKENQEVFHRIKLVPRILRNVANVQTAPKPLWGMDMSFPVMVAPMAMHGMAHPDRELATSRAAARAGIPFVFSTMATSSLEELAPTGPNLIFQLYVIRNRDIVKGWVQQAEALGFKALMITVDAPRLAKREADERNKFTLPAGLQLKNLAPLHVLKAAEAAAAAASQVRSLDLDAKPQDGALAATTAVDAIASADKATNARDNTEGSGLMKLFACEIDDSLTWEFIPWLRTITKLPIIVKGLLSPEDAKLALQYGVDGIVVSNHGGRQLDYSPSAIEMLPSVLKEVGGRIPVLVDGGIRRGTDVLKAIAMGASAVLLGRPVLYGLAVGGEEGVLRVCQLLKNEFELAMALAGCASVSDISAALLRLPADMRD